jgi:hypothetical protein
LAECIDETWVGQHVQVLWCDSWPPVGRRRVLAVWSIA